jgi:3-oxoacyl-[acyl-carrier protein] reductase
MEATGNLEVRVGVGAGEGRVLLVTGAGGGLGGALVRGFARAGWRVAAAGHRERPEGIGDEVAGVAGWVLDVTDGEACRRVVAEVEERWGRIDVLVHSAGVAVDRRITSMSEADWDRVMDVNLKGAFLVGRAVLPGMVRRREGLVVNIGSQSGRCGAVGQVNYAAAKAGLVGLSLSLAREMAGAGIRVNVVLPGVMPTKMTAGMSEGAREALVGANLTGRMNRPEDVVALVGLLAEARNVSGQVFAWDSRVARWG